MEIELVQDLRPEGSTVTGGEDSLGSNPSEAELPMREQRA
jgi:hypothetical protein